MYVGEGRCMALGFTFELILTTRDLREVYYIIMSWLAVSL